MLVHDPVGGFVGCEDSRFDQTVISESTIDSAAFLRFEVPPVRQWSIGFIYHDERGGTDTDTATFVYANQAGEIRARHWVRTLGENIHEPPSEQVRSGTLKTGPGELNELVFRTSSTGSLLRLNDEIVIEIPSSQLVRKNEWSRVCVGFHSEEDESYSIRYEDLRTRFDERGSSGIIEVSEDDIEDGKIECPYLWERRFLAREVIDSWMLMDVTFPTRGDWSFGLTYHIADDRDSRSMITRDGSSHYTEHLTYDNGEFEEVALQYFSASDFSQGSMGSNLLEFETTVDGSWLRLNGKKIMDVDGSELTRRMGSVIVCANLYVNEATPYEISFSNMWFWSE